MISTSTISGVHVPYIELAGRIYPHVPSPIKKKSESDDVLMKLHRAQWAPFRSRARFRTVVAGRRWGKTHWVCVELLQAATAKSKQKCWYIAPTYTMAKQIAWEKLKEIVPRSWIGINHMGMPKVNETSLTITLRNGSTISLKGSDRPDSLRGVGISFLVLDEYQDMKPTVWISVRPTLSDEKGRAIFIGTPKSFNHLYEMYRRGKKGNPQWASWQFATSDSPFIALSEIEHAKEDLDPRSFRQEYEASFETVAGRVYYDFHRDHNVKPCPYDPSRLTIVGQDFNIDPMSSSIVQYGPKGEIWITGELSIRGSSTEDVCRNLLMEYGRDMTERTVVYPDPAGAYRQHARGESDLQIFREWGFNRILHRPRHPPVRDRIAAVNRLLCDAKGNRRLFIDPSATKHIEAFEKLIYKEGTSEPDKSLGIEHPCDAFGYFAEYEFPIKRPFSVGGGSF